jgi:hypothetical protein
MGEGFAFPGAYTVTSPGASRFLVRFSRGRLMVFVADLAGYFDDSGTHAESRTSVCAGYISSVEQWRQLTRNWEDINAVEPFLPFHTPDCLGGYEQFAGWSEERKYELMRKLIGVTNLRAKKGFISAVVKQDYDKVIPDWLKARTGKNHYTFCVWSCFGLISEWREKTRTTRPIQYVFDLIPPGKGERKGEIIRAFHSFLKHGNADMIGAYPEGLSFQSRKSLPPLQAADMIASAAGWHMNHRVLAGRPAEAEPWFKDIMSMVPRPKNRYFDKENLSEFVVRMEKHRDDPNWGIDCT